jgi:hypothetical protein
MVLQLNPLVNTKTGHAAPKWFRLDNAAKIYPVVAGPQNGHVFRISMTLTEDIDPKLLQQAVFDLKPRFPTFYVRMRRGFFWYYYEKNERTLEVKPEPPFMCKSIDFFANNGYQFSCYYHKKRISVEVFHSICDGNGALEYTKSLVYRYLELKGYPMESENMVLTVDQSPSAEEMEDSFLKNYKEGPSTRPVVNKAYEIKGTPFIQGGTGVITGKMSVEELKKVAKDYNATVTQFLAALLAYSILKTGDRKRLARRPVNIFIPVNMRKYFNSKTLRNFSLYFYSIHKYKDDSIELKEILEKTKQDFEEKLNLAHLLETMKANVAAEKNLAVRGSPLFVKKLLLKAGYSMFANRLATATITNLGNVVLPSSMSKYVEDVELNLGARYKSGPNAAVVSCKGVASVAFSRGIKEKEVEKTFFRFLSEQGIKVEIQGNYWEKYF